MVFRGQLDGSAGLLSIKSSSISLAVGNAWVAAWDLGGRLFSVWKNGHTYRRGLSGRVLHKWRDLSGEGGRGLLSPYDARQREALADQDADALLDEAADRASGVSRELRGGPAGWTSDDVARPDASALEVLERCARFDAAAGRLDARRFASIFSPVGILPPDQYLSTVLQATEGCSFGTCTFCDLYREPYRVKSVEEFVRHARAVREYLGESIRLRGRSVFLGAANALAVPTARMVEFLDAIPAVFGAVRPVHAFVDGFTGMRKRPADYAALRERGLRRVYVGLESGHDPLLSFVRKPSTGAEAVQAVRAIKDGGLSVGVIVMIGLGGRRFAEGHVRDTADAVNEMRLGAGDLLFFSDLVEVPGTSYPQIAAVQDIEPLSLDQRLDQQAAIASRLAFDGPPPQFARYDVREFVY